VKLSWTRDKSITEHHFTSMNDFCGSK